MAYEWSKGEPGHVCLVSYRFIPSKMVVCDNLSAQIVAKSSRKSLLILTLFFMRRLTFVILI
jgi:hypothetical protein